MICLRLFLLVAAGCSSFPCFSQDADRARMDWGRLQAEEFSKEQASGAIKQLHQFKESEITPEELKGKKFDAGRARNDVRTPENSLKKANSEVVELVKSQKFQENQRNTHFHEDEHFIERSEEIAKAVEEDPLKFFEQKILKTESVSEKLVECRQSGDPYSIGATRSLTVSIKHQPAVKETKKICKEHHEGEVKFWSSTGAENEKRRREKGFSKDPQIEWYEVSIRESGSVNKRYYVAAKYKHKDTTSNDPNSGCNHFVKKESIVQQERFIEEDVWDQQEVDSLSVQSHCTLVEQQCIDSGTKTIDGRSVHRECWKERILYRCKFPEFNDCSVLKLRKCNEISRKCAKQFGTDCALWSKTYKCFDTTSEGYNASASDPIYGLAGEYNKPSIPNGSFANALVKLSILDEIKKGFEAEFALSSATDARLIQIFKGKRYECSRNVAEKIMYDCCFSYSGLAKEMSLAKCTEEETDLGHLRESGKCHYIGTYSEKLFDVLWKSRDVFVYSCFPSKLARVFQEQARKQLKKDWGTAESPRCEGLSHTEVERLDFSRMDFSEIEKDLIEQLPSNIESKLKSFENQLDSINERLKNDQTEINKQQGWQ